ncbi:hypothetical protein B0T42_10410, partial [Rathayibacter sp. VKM Ac-2630]
MTNDWEPSRRSRPGASTPVRFCACTSSAVRREVAGSDVAATMAATKDRATSPPTRVRGAGRRGVTRGAGTGAGAR